MAKKRSVNAPVRQAPWRIMRYAVDPRVDTYIDSLPDWQQVVWARAYADGFRAVTSEVAATGLPYQKRQPSLRVATSSMPSRRNSRA